MAGRSFCDSRKFVNVLPSARFRQVAPCKVFGVELVIWFITCVEATSRRGFLHHRSPALDDFLSVGRFGECDKKFELVGLGYTKPFAGKAEQIDLGQFGAQASKRVGGKYPAMYVMICAVVHYISSQPHGTFKCKAARQVIGSIFPCQAATTSMSTLFTQKSIIS